MQKALWILLLLVTAPFMGLAVHAETPVAPLSRFTVVHVSGVMYKRPAWYYVLKNDWFDRYHAFTHHSLRSKIERALEDFDCVQGVQRDARGLIIFTDSWGSQKATELAQKYFDRCGRKVSLFLMLDGVKKPSMRAFMQSPLADRCVNFYQTQSALNGGAVQGCENEDLSYLCAQTGRRMPVVGCHVYLHRKAPMQVIRHRAFTALLPLMPEFSALYALHSSPTELLRARILSHELYRSFFNPEYEALPEWEWFAEFIRALAI